MNDFQLKNCHYTLEEDLGGQHSGSKQCTRLGDLLEFGQLFKACGKKSPTFLGNFCNLVKIFNFSSEIFLGQLL